MAAAKSQSTTRFKGLATAKTFESGVYLTDGEYRVEIKKCIVKNTRNKGDAFIVEYTVLESSVPDKHPVGSTRTWYQGMSDQDIAFGAMKSFFAAVLNMDLHNDAEKSELEEGIEQTATDAVEKNALAGMKVYVKCHTKITKEKKVNFTVHNFSFTK